VMQIIEDKTDLSQVLQPPIKTPTWQLSALNL
jgi:hypothetical protein